MKKYFCLWGPLQYTLLVNMCDVFLTKMFRKLTAEAKVRKSHSTCNPQVGKSRLVSSQSVAVWVGGVGGWAASQAWLSQGGL